MAETSGWLPDSQAERAFQALTGEDSLERACRSIPESACTALPRNYLLNLGNGACTKLAEQLASPGLVLPWLLAASGAPAVFVGLLVPIKQAGSLLPQLATAARIRSLARRKWAWTGAGLFQAFCLAVMGAAALFLPPVALGVAVVVLLALFSMASGVGSVAFQDVIAKTVPKGQRGRLLSLRATVGGALTLAAAAALKVWLGDDRAVESLVPLILAAALLWMAGALLFAGIEERPGETGGGRDMGAELKAGMKLLREVPGFRRFMSARALLLAVEVAAPFLILLAHEGEESAVTDLGLYIFAMGLANVLSSPVWGPFADRSSRLVMGLGGLLLSVAAGLSLLVALFAPEALQPWGHALAFLILGIAEAGVRLGRKTYLVDAAPGDERPLYVAVSNSLAGLLALAAGLLGLMVDLTGALPVVGLLALLGLAGWLATRALPEADEMVKG